MPFDRNSPATVAPARGGAAVTKSDSTVVNFRALYVGGTGDVAVTAEDGNDVTFESVPAGSILPISVTKVLSTGTTATKIVGLK
jgi:hypothetical protein